jgi:putative DNA primase/helicase
VTAGLQEAIAAAGLGAPEIIADGQLHRFHVEGDRQGSKNGWLVAHLNGTPAGAFGSWKTGQTQIWCAKRRSDMTASERNSYRNFVSSARAQRESAREETQVSASKRAHEIWSSARAAPDDHLYLLRKRASAHDLRVWNGKLVVPVRDPGGNLKSLQFIDRDGKKRFLKGGTVRGNFHMIGRPLSVAYVCEGYATAATVHGVTRQLAVIAFDAGNLAPAAAAIKKKYPGLGIVIAADNDAGTEGNPGLKYGGLAAQAVGGILVYPRFDNGDSTDFNDLFLLSGAAEVKNQLEAPQAARDQFESVATGGDAASQAEQKRVVDKLALLDEVSYDRQRVAAAKELGCRALTLDKLVAQRRAELNEERSISSLKPASVIPWPDPVDGAALLDELSDTITRFVVVPRGSEVIISLWITFTYLFDGAYCCPILALISPEKRCGKTTLLGLLAKLVNRPLPASNISPSALFRAVELWKPTLLIDEGDAFLHDSEELRGILNSGHTADTAFVVRSVGDDHTPQCFSTWAPKAFAAIGKLLDTIDDRSVAVKLKRKASDEKVEKRRRHHDGDLLELQRKIARWADDNRNAFSSADQLEISGLNDRARDNFEPLCQIAELAGGGWPKAAMGAATQLAGMTVDDSTRIQLLSDIREIFAVTKNDRLPSKELASRLGEMEDRRWPEFRNFQPITQRQIAMLLHDFEIAPKVMRVGSKTPSCYALETFLDAFSRYLPPYNPNTSTND